MPTAISILEIHAHGQHHCSQAVTTALGPRPAIKAVLLREAGMTKEVVVSGLTSRQKSQSTAAVAHRVVPICVFSESTAATDSAFRTAVRGSHICLARRSLAVVYRGIAIRGGRCSAVGGQAMNGRIT